jgi:hypothetical protein
MSYVPRTWTRSAMTISRRTCRNSSGGGGPPSGDPPPGGDRRPTGRLPAGRLLHQRVMAHAAARAELGGGDLVPPSGSALQDMPRAREALMSGEISRSALRVLAAAREAHPEECASTEEVLVEAARNLSIRELRRAAAYWRQAVDSARAEEDEGSVMSTPINPKASNVGPEGEPRFQRELQAGAEVGHLGDEGIPGHRGGIARCSAGLELAPYQVRVVNAQHHQVAGAAAVQRPAHSVHL